MNTINTNIAATSSIDATKSKGGRPKNKKPSLPIHPIPNAEAVIPAVLDLLWRQPGLLMRDIMAHLIVGEEKRSATIAMIHQSKLLEKSVSGITTVGKPIERWRAIGKRTGWYYRGKLWHVRELLPLALIKSDSTLQHRLHAGMSVKEALKMPAKYNGLKNKSEVG